ncbi:hypothetical protein P8C59_005839 [Phyllachora maydis]|uniref:Altered inheritance of mitochondria protein 6 n=1 Tax=Phyllachora maydis TaxID=1825666 RepID=A0AAD9I5I2_9PEZI|nr:hypothetical protein P8C59_005839 [Phyllachora maydis]
MFSGLVAACAAVLVAAQSSIPLSSGLQSILAEEAASVRAAYPTNLTQGIVPKGFHSHNDYWRRVPFWSALAAGATSIEADVWLYNGTLYVGHDESALSPSRTLDSLYLQPLLQVLRAQNPASPFVAGGPTRNGVFDTAPGQTLHLFIDVKTDGPTTWPQVVGALGPLRRAGYLTSVDGAAVAPGPVTVVGTGNTPRGLVEGVSPRDYFWDGPLATLNGTDAHVTRGVSPVASADFAAVLGPVVGGPALDADQTARLRAQVAHAHAKGILVRYWDLPGWPVGTRNAVWRILADAGVDLINVDDLAAIADF